jgi:hypothetical protein
MFVIGITAIHGRGNGSLYLTDIQSLLVQRKTLFDQVSSDFDISRSGDAAMITRNENIKLNGARVGPYTFWLRPKGSSGPYTYEMRIETRITFTDAAGHKVSLHNAAQFKEELIDMAIRPLRSDEFFTPDE